MIKPLFSIIKKILGKKLTNKVRPIGHGVKTYLAASINGFPAKKIKIIGITGTKGKTSTTVLTGRLLNRLGAKAGYISTATVNLGGGEEFINPHKMTSIDGAVLHKYLKEMVENGCEWAVLEMSSQGLEQNRHIGLGGFDIGVFLNLFPEHLEAHGGIDNYIRIKSRLFKNIKEGGIFLADGSFSETEEMWSAISPKIQKSVKKVLLRRGRDYDIIDNRYSLFKMLRIGGEEVKTNFYGDFELVNLVFAINLSHLVSNATLTSIFEIVPELKGIPGRMEFVVNTPNIDIMVDYAHEPESMRRLLKTLHDWKDRGLYDRVVHIVSCDGVGRDDWKKPVLGDISYKYADFSIITTDNFGADDNPEDIVNILSQNFSQIKEGKKYLKVTSRKKAFETAIENAKDYLIEDAKKTAKIGSEKKVVIVSTGVGVECGLTQPNGVMEWDEGGVWREIAKEKELF